MQIHKDIDCVLAAENEIDQIVSELADEINMDYAHIDGVKSKLLVIGVLKGAVIFMTDLIRKIDLPLRIDFIQVSSYGTSADSSGDLIVKYDLSDEYDLKEYDVLVIEDIIDRGYTLNKLTADLKQRGAKSVAACVFLDKPARRVVEYTPEYIGKIIPDVFVVGYGLDYSERYRELPYIGVLKPAVYL